MLLLSDGEPTAGVRDVPGFGSIAARAMAQGVSITTVGVDVSYNERVMTAIAAGSNGRHYFVENDRDLGKVFEAEAQTLTETVASNAIADFDLAPGVELLQVFDRTFTRSGSQVSVPIGSLAKGEVRTVLLKVRVPRSDAGQAKLADVRVSFRDVANGKDVSEQSKLSVELLPAGTATADMDGVVLDRLQRSETSAALLSANSLFASGKADEAQARLADAQQALRANRRKAEHAAPAPRKAGIDRSFEAQENELNRASGGFATPPAAAPGTKAPAPADVDRKQRATQRENAAKSNDLGL
jgi:Ca-activated chloride channel family protein